MATFIWRGQWGQIGVAIASMSGVFLYQGSTIAQIVPDGTLGTESSVVTPNLDIKGVPSDRIDAGAVRGTNLFHSFQEFNVEAGRGVYFSNPTGIENILTRVTGGNVSNIFGRLGVLGKANLFLLNPNGIIFGPGASLDLSGSFVASTGNSLNFGDGIEFSATNPAAPPLLRVSVPLGVQFPQEQPRAIVNAGNLAVEMGQNLTLLGGTVASTGQLSAPGGQVAVAAVPSGAVVNLSPSAQLLRIDTPSPVAGVGASETLSPSSATLAELLIGKDGEINVPLRVNSNGQVELVGSGLPVTIVDGDVVAQNVIAQTATLSAYRNLTLVESQLGTMGDLNLLAGDTVRVRDSATKPFVAQAGGRLLVQGNQSIDIFALNHPYSGLVSGGDMVLRSANTVGGDAHYWTGGSFRIEKLDGSLGGLFSPYDPIIRARGDVSFASYTGGSLHIFAGGSVTISGTVEITDVDETNGLIESEVPLSDGTLINIDGKTSPTLDIRAGTIAFDTVGIIPEPIPGIDNSANFGSSPTSANITIGAIVNRVYNTVNDETVNGQVFLTNKYEPNLNLPGGSIKITGGVNLDNTGVVSIAAYGNPVTIDSRGDVSIAQGINTSPSDGDGGDVKILSGGNIDTTGGSITSFANSTNSVAGDVTLTAAGNIYSGSIEASSNKNEDQNNPEREYSVITLNSLKGSVFLNEVKLTTENTGSALAGDIIIDAAQDVIITGNIKTDDNMNNTGEFNLSSDGYFGRIIITAGRNVSIDNSILKAEAPSGLPSSSTSTRAGNIEITSNYGQIAITNSSLSTTTNSPYADPGNISITAEKGQILIKQNSEIKSIIEFESGADDANFPEIKIKGNSVEISDSTVETKTSGFAAGANIYVDAINGGSIKINNSTVDAGTFGSGDGGNILLTAGSDILIDNGSEIYIDVAIAEASGKGGNLTIKANTLTIQGKSFASANSVGSGTAGSISIDATQSVLLSGGSDSPTNFPALLERVDDGKLGDPDIIKEGLFEGGLFAEATTQGGIAGQISIVTGDLTVKDGVVVAVNSPKGQAGNVVILANNVLLDNGAILARTSKIPETELGANIIILGNQNPEPESVASEILKNELGENPLPDFPVNTFILKNESLILADATNDAKAGNIVIRARLILAFPPTGENGSDISANAEGGAGGRVVIDARPLGIYNIEFRARQTSLNDITASSDSGPAGIVTITPPDVDPRTGLIQLPENLADSANLIAQSCLIGGQRAASRFVITGRGGLPSNPSSALSSETLLGDAASTPPPENSSNSTSPTDSGSDSPVEAQGVKIGPNGEIVLTAHPSNYTPYSSWQKVGGCNEQ